MFICTVSISPFADGLYMAWLVDDEVIQDKEAVYMPMHADYRVCGYEIALFTAIITSCAYLLYVKYLCM